MKLSRLFIFFLPAGLLLLAACTTSGELGSTSDLTPTPIGTVQPEPVPLTFVALDADPFAFLHKSVRVTGAFVPVRPVACVPFKGPRTRWSLVADGLQMDVNGLPQLLELVPDGALLTVDGIWRRHEGPVGCGKEPATQVIWYLEARRVVDPNPMEAGNFTVVAVNLNTPAPTPAVTATATLSVTGRPGAEIPTESPQVNTPTPQPFGGGTPIPTATPSPSLTPSPQPSDTPSPTPSPAPTADETADGSATVTPSLTPSPSPTPGEGGGSTDDGDDNPPTVTPSSTPTPSPTATNDANGGGGGTIGGSDDPTAVPSTPQPTTDSGGYPGNGGGGGGGGYP